MDSKVITGQSRSGKTTNLIALVTRVIGAVAKVIIDPQFSLSRMALLGLYNEAAERHIRLIQLAQFRRGFGFLNLRKSNHPDPMIRQFQDETEIWNFARILLARNSLSASHNRLIWEWLYGGASALLYTQRPPHWLPFAFQPKTKRYHAITRACTCDATREKLLSIREFSTSRFRMEVSPALRICQAACSDPAFIACCGDIDWFEQLRKRRIIILSGQGASLETIRTILIAAISKTIQFSETHNIPVELYVDEWSNYGGLLTNEFGNAIASLQKANASYILASQVLSGAPETVLEKILENCQTHRYFRLSHMATIRTAAAEIAAASGGSATAIQHEITQLPTGGYIEVSYGRVRRCHPPKPKEIFPWPGLEEKKLQQMIDRIYSHPEYHNPQATDPTPQRRPDGGHGESSSAISSEPTPPPTNNALPPPPGTDSSQAARRRKRQQQSGE